LENPVKNPVKGAKKHHYLVAGKVMFLVKNEEGEPQGLGSIELNAMATSQFNYLTAQRLGQAQQSLQLRAIQKVGEVQIEDVVISSISYLGHMTDDEFGATSVDTATASDEATDTVVDATEKLAAKALAN
jgi:hypothetical protein